MESGEKLDGLFQQPSNCRYRSNDFGLLMSDFVMENQIPKKNC